MATVMLPAARPRLSADALHSLIAPFQIDRQKYPLVVAGIRGYYLDSLGVKGKNDRGIYDDAIFLDSVNATIAFNANTDPSIFRVGTGKAEGIKGIASLKPGVWYVHKFAKHKEKYLALCQRAGEVTVLRDGKTAQYEDTGNFGINIHKGGYNTTSSEGCQTIHPAQWESFIATAKSETQRSFGNKWQQVVIPYVLIENTGSI